TAQATDSSSTPKVASQALMLSVTDTDAYGGRTDLQCPGGATGRFHTGLIGSRMWLCTSAGNAMFGQGAYGAGPQGNYIAKYGSEATAFEQTLSRLKDWGFNFLHAYSAAGM